MAHFKVGDVVQLKSGGPRMTVHHIYDPNSGLQIDNMLRAANLVKGAVLVTYFDNKNEVVKNNFAPELLRIIDERA